MVWETLSVWRGGGVTANTLCLLILTSYVTVEDLALDAVADAACLGILADFRQAALISEI